MNTSDISIPAMAADIIVRRFRLLIIRHHMRRHRRHLLAAQRHEEIADRHLDYAAGIATKFRV